MLFKSVIFDLPSLLNGLLSNPDIDVDSAENSVE